MIEWKQADFGDSYAFRIGAFRVVVWRPIGIKDEPPPNLMYAVNDRHYKTNSRNVEAVKALALKRAKSEWENFGKALGWLT